MVSEMTRLGMAETDFQEMVLLIREGVVKDAQVNPPG